MKQLLQSLRTGETEVADVPAPAARAGQLLIRTRASLVSAGTERMLVEFGQANLIEKARQQPDKVKMVLEKARTDGVATTLDAVRSKLDQPLALGYCNVGRVIESGVDGFAPGDRVVSNGKHAEIVAVPKNLCARIPDAVSDETASFTVLAAIGLQGIRLASPTLGECAVVTGLGLIGLLTVQLLRAQGCRVLGIDFDEQRLELARRFGAETVNPAAGEDVVARATSFSRGAGVDLVIITASTKSNDPVAQAARMCRKRGRIVLVGVVGLELSRADFYEKELSFQVSCSYGPGRYDPAYEDGGQDYPIGFVRWTEQRNFEAVLDLMASGQIDTAPLLTHRFAIEDGGQAMSQLASKEPSLGILIEYPDHEPEQVTVERRVPLGSITSTGAGVVGFLGAGNYAGRVLIPAFKEGGATLQTVVSAGGVSAVHFGRKFAFANAATEGSAIFEDDALDTVVIATRHDAHARQVLAALSAGKHVFCEKPLCLTLDELGEIERTARERPAQRLMVGFNRRFAPQVVRMKGLLARVETPKNIVITVNAGDIPADHWTQDEAVGGGRIVGEACHFIDLARHLADAPIVRHHIAILGAHPTLAVRSDKAAITLEFADGSVATILYLANGHKAFPKERIEVFAAGRILQLDNFRKLRGWGWQGFKSMNLFRQDKGVTQAVAAFLSEIRDGAAPHIPLDQIVEVSAVSINLAREAADGLITWIDRRFYPGYQRNWDDLIFRQRILDAITPESDVLDIGAGAGIVEAMNFRGKARKVCGIDLDPRVVDNPYLDEAAVGDGGRLPYPDESFDIAFADNVMEHLDRPSEVFREINRVLRPGGKLLFKTPNRSHYMPVIARMTPHRFHQWFNRLRGRTEIDTFPTRYRANSASQVRALAKETGFEVDAIDLVEGRPEYLRVTAISYVGGLLYERIVNAIDGLATFRVLLIATLEKKRD